jgi:transposase
MVKNTAQLVDWIEGRRLRAWDLVEQGWSQTKVAQALGVTEGAVSQWIKRGKQGGRDALRRRPPPGPSPRLSPEQLLHLKQLLSQPATSYGFIGEVWTTKRVTAIIKEHFAVSYHHAHVSRILKALDLTPQLPETRATQRDEEQITDWNEQKWPSLKKKPSEKSGHSSG